jgi:hypothetical protein
VRMKRYSPFSLISSQFFHLPYVLYLYHDKELDKYERIIADRHIPPGPGFALNNDIRNKQKIDT